MNGWPDHILAPTYKITDRVKVKKTGEPGKVIMVYKSRMTGMVAYLLRLDAPNELYGGSLSVFTSDELIPEQRAGA